MKKSLYLFALLLIAIFLSCGNRQQLKSFNNVMTGDDSLAIELGNSDTIFYHSPDLNIDISYPSYLRHQFLADDQMEVFMTDDVSLSFMVQDLQKGDDIFRTPGQQLMGMGAELIEADVLRYNPNHSEAAKPLRQLVHDYMPSRSMHSRSDSSQ